MRLGHCSRGISCIGNRDTSLPRRRQGIRGRPARRRLDARDLGLGNPVGFPVPPVRVSRPNRYVFDEPRNLTIEELAGVWPARSHRSVDKQFTSMLDHVVKPPTNRRQSATRQQVATTLGLPGHTAPSTAARFPVDDATHRGRHSMFGKLRLEGWPVPKRAPCRAPRGGDLATAGHA